MKITMSELQSYFYTEGMLKEVLPAIQDELDRSDYYDGVMIQNFTDNAEECKKAAAEMSGLHGRLIKVYEFAEGAIKKLEPLKKYAIRVKAEQDSQKITESAIVSLAENEMGEYRRIRHYVLGYVEALDKSIGTLQSIIKYEGSPKGTPARPDHTQQ
jgi:hypothetical protein